MVSVAGLTVLLLRRIGYRWPMVVGFSLIALGMVTLALPASVLGQPAYRWLAFGAGITGIGMGMAAPPANNAGLQMAPDRVATVAGLRGMFRQVGGITGVSVTSAILARSADPGLTQAWVFGGLAVALVLVLPLIRLVPERLGTW
jgi:MFS family permease